MTTVIRNILIIIVAALFVAVLLALGIYGFGMDNGATRYLAKLIPLPAAMAGGEPVTISELNEYEIALRNSVYFTTDPKLADDSEYFKKQREIILENLIRDAIASKLAAANNIRISEEELDRYYEYVLFQIGVDRESAAEKIRGRFGFTENEFKEKIVRPEFLRDKLGIFLNSANTDSKAQDEARFVKSLLDEENIDFAEGAALYSEDMESKSIGGEIGVFEKHELPPWLAGNIDNLSEGDLSRVIITPEGYEIYQLLSRFENKFHLARILIKGENVDEYIDSHRDSIRVYTFL